MKISMNSWYFYWSRTGRKRSLEEVLRLCYDAGFRTVDTEISWGDDWEARADATMNAAAKVGIEIEQSHAPYNFYERAPREVFLKSLKNSAKAAVKMGLKYLVFHADEYHPPKGGPFDPKAALEAVYDSLAPCIEILTAGGVRAGLETTDEDRGRNTPLEQRTHFCADINELIAIIDRFNDPMVGCCWDFGHARLAFGRDKHAEMIKKMGSRIICTHVQDNRGGGMDIHLPPFFGDLKWEELMAALKSTGYKGSLTFEVIYSCLPDALVPDHARQLYRIGETLSDMFEKA